MLEVAQQNCVLLLCAQLRMPQLAGFQHSKCGSLSVSNGPVQRCTPSSGNQDRLTLPPLNLSLVSLQACCFRRSVRQASKQVIHSLRRAAKEHPGWSAEQQEGSAAHAVRLLVSETCQVIANLQEVSLPPNWHWGPCSWELHQ